MTIFTFNMGITILGKMVFILKQSPGAIIGATKYYPVTLVKSQLINSLRPGQNGHHFPDNILWCIFMNEKFCIFTKISPKLVPKGPNNNIPALVQIMAWCRTGNKPLSGLMLTQFTDAYMWRYGEMS